MNRSNPLCAMGIGAALVLVANPPAAFATVRVATLIGSHMMVQRNRPIRLWGTAAPGESVRATLAGGKAAKQADVGPPNTLRNRADLPAAPFRSDEWPAPSSDAGP